MFVPYCQGERQRCLSHAQSGRDWCNLKSMLHICISPDLTKHAFASDSPIAHLNWCTRFFLDSRAQNQIKDRYQIKFDIKKIYNIVAFSAETVKNDHHQRQMYDLRHSKESTASVTEIRTRSCVRACTIPATRGTRMIVAPAPVTVAGSLCFPERFVEFLEGQLVRMVDPREGGLPGSDGERGIADSADRHEGSDGRSSTRTYDDHGESGINMRTAEANDIE